MKKAHKKLTLHRESLKVLTEASLKDAAGGLKVNNITPATFTGVYQATRFGC